MSRFQTQVHFLTPPSLHPRVITTTKNEDVNGGNKRIVLFKTSTKMRERGVTGPASQTTLFVVFAANNFANDADLHLQWARPAVDSWQHCKHPASPAQPGPARPSPVQPALFRHVPNAVQLRSNLAPSSGWKPVPPVIKLKMHSVGRHDISRVPAGSLVAVRHVHYVLGDRVMLGVSAYWLKGESRSISSAREMGSA
jgi:hypothetical protein